ncbi:hypothetical protein TNCV_4782481 [Trichonephila clavipes]|nr:hypothetical protein TNCV_4782481 [Trichonephila clavipes]
MAEYTNAEKADMILDTGPQIAMVEPLRSCTLKGILSGGLLLIPCLLAYTSNYVRPVHSRRQHVIEIGWHVPN